MDRIIEVKVNGSFITKDNKTAGVQHEANVTFLRITFDKGWNSYAKKVTWWGALGQNPVEVTLTTALLEDAAKSTLTYLCPIPGEALADAGRCSFVIDGYAEGRRMRSVSDELVVKAAPIAEAAGEPADPTPTQAEQLQAGIDAINEAIQEAAGAAEAAKGATAAAQSAAESATAAATSAQSAADSAEKAAESENSAAESAAKSENAQATVETAKAKAETAAADASSSAAAAAKSASAASVSGGNAATSANAAAGSAQSASLSQQAAAQSASAAAESAANASASEKNAADSETAAKAAQTAAEKARDETREIAGGDFASRSEAQSYADTAEANAKAYTDTAEAKIRADTETGIDAANLNAKTYAHNAELNSQVYADTVEANAKAYTDEKIAAIPTPNVSGQINTHNTDTSAHSDIRELIEGLSGSVASLDSAKVNVSDIVDNLTSEDSGKPLSAAQGVVLKKSIDSANEALAAHKTAWNPHNITVKTIGAATTETFIVAIDTSWTANSAGGYYKTVTVSGMLADDNPIADVVLGSDVSANALYLEAWALVTRISTAANSITLYASEAPATAFSILLKVVR